MLLLQHQDQVFTTTAWPQPYQTNMQVPTPETYKQWYSSRVLRTEQVAQRQNKIGGRQILEENLSVRLLYDLGYTLNSATDTMEKLDVRT